MEISTIQNYLMVLALIFLVLYGVASLSQTKPHWFCSKTFLKTKKLQQTYTKLIQSRREMIHHYYWSKSNNEKSQMKKLQKEVLKIDKQLEEIRSQYEIVRKGLPVPLRMF